MGTGAGTAGKSQDRSHFWLWGLGGASSTIAFDTNAIWEIVFCLSGQGFFAASASALVTPLTPRAWPSGTVTCGSASYSLSAVKAAVSQGVSHLDNPIGSNSYPHT